jgi:hypothetical protein
MAAGDAPGNCKQTLLRRSPQIDLHIVTELQAKALDHNRDRALQGTPSAAQSALNTSNAGTTCKPSKTPGPVTTERAIRGTDRTNTYSKTV